jgi:predicted secreted protein
MDHSHLERTCGMKKAQTLHQRLKDSRSRKVIFLSHCILNENTRYLGGACKSGCVTEIVEQCLRSDWGIVQMPCPEQHAWGGVTKRWLLMAYGTKGTFLYHVNRLFLPLFRLYIKLLYRRLAKSTAEQVKDYIVSGYSVVGVMGIDGSPSCGVNTTLDLDRSLELVASMDVESVTVEQMNDVIRQSLADGRGLFTIALQKELSRRHIDVPFDAHDLVAELNGENSSALATAPL